jgi:aquaporin Z
VDGPGDGRIVAIILSPRRAITRRGHRRGVASLLLQGAPAHKAVHYAATMAGIYGDAIALVAELAVSFILMSAILVAAFAFESPSGMSTNPARTFGPALNGSYWHALWIYFVAPPLGMLAAP